MFTVHRMCLAALLLGAMAGVQAGDIYRWVDDQGRTHWSDAVPEKYRDRATRVDTRQYELTSEQQREAAERAARERARTPVAPKPPAVPAPATPEVPAPVLIKRPVEKVTESTDCATWWRLYRESQECFGPFHTMSGGLKPEAFDHCNGIPSPELQCGPYRD